MRPTGTFPGREGLEKDFFEPAAAKLFTVACGALAFLLGTG
jgi:hypothetical protein